MPAARPRLYRKPRWDPDTPRVHGNHRGLCQRGGRAVTAPPAQPRRSLNAAPPLPAALLTARQAPAHAGARPPPGWDGPVPSGGAGREAASPAEWEGKGPRRLFSSLPLEHVKYLLSAKEDVALKEQLISRILFLKDCPSPRGVA